MKGQKKSGNTLKDFNSQYEYTVFAIQKQFKDFQKFENGSFKFLTAAAGLFCCENKPLTMLSILSAALPPNFLSAIVKRSSFPNRPAKRSAWVISTVFFYCSSD